MGGWPRVCLVRLQRAVGAVAVACALAVGTPAGAHPGGLNGEGCHNNRKTGDYHCHRPGAGTAAPAASSAERHGKRLRRARVRETFTGRVVGVTDGDTLSVMRGGRAQKIRLYGVDAPEKRQAFGSKAKWKLAGWTYNKVVTVRVHTVDRYGRLVAEVILPDGRNVSEELVRAGLAWMYRKYTSDRVLDRLETAARRSGVGVWSDPRIVPPWKYRAATR